MSDDSIMTLGEVCGFLQLSRSRILQYDGYLQPTRDDTGKRVYHRPLVERLAAERRTAEEQAKRGVRW